MIITGKHRLRSASLIFGAAIVSSLGLIQAVSAQANLTLEEIVVTAQKRSQSLQEVPIAVSALTEDIIEVNRVVNITDISSLSPATYLLPTAGGSNVPQITIRGRQSTGVVSGADKQVSIYLDGVYIASPRGGIFNLPDIAQIEVLRGPQGTLFGRNATAGAVSVTTRDPSGEFGFTQGLTFGNRDLFKSRTSVDLPQMGPFSAYFSYLQEEADGDVDNLAAGVRFDRTGFGQGIDTSPATFRAKDTNGLFVAVAFEPSDTFRMTYKYDYAEEDNSPDATVVGYALSNPTFLDAMLAGSPDVAASIIEPSTTRPDSVYSPYTTNRIQEVEGHNLTATWEINEKMTLKNVFAYRESFVWAPVDLGLGGMDPYLFINGTIAYYAGLAGYPPQALDPEYPYAPGDLFYCFACANPYSEDEQTSNELQFNYDSDLVTLTLGALYFEQEGLASGPPGAAGTMTNATFVNGPNGWVIPAAGDPIRSDWLGGGIAEEAISMLDAKSYAGYVQAEWHLTDQLDLVTGFRITRDEKDMIYRHGVAPDYVDEPSEYRDTNNSYLLGVNYSLNDDIFLYGKYSTAFVSGGKIGPVAFDPEEVESFELGIKADFLDGRLRANVALFDATYKDPQTANSASIVAKFISDEVLEDIGVTREELESFGLLQFPIGGDLEVWGIELEVTALPMEGLVLSGSLGYTDREFKDIGDLQLSASGFDPADPEAAGKYELARDPEMTGYLSAHYESAPLFGTVYLRAGISGNWRDEYFLDPNPDRSNAIPQLKRFYRTPAGWVVNARLALMGIQMGDWEGKVSLWGRNLTDNDDPIYMLNLDLANTPSYLEARSYGLDLEVSF